MGALGGLEKMEGLKEDRSHPWNKWHCVASEAAPNEWANQAEQLLTGYAKSTSSRGFSAGLCSPFFSIIKLLENRTHLYFRLNLVTEVVRVKAWVLASITTKAQPPSPAQAN